MRNKLVFPLVTVLTIGVAASFNGCSCGAEAKIGNTEPKAATPPPPPPPEPPPPPPPPEKPPEIKAVGKAKIEGDDIKIPGKIQFDFDKATIKNTKETQEVLDTLLNVMKENKAITKLRIEGHTDDVGGTEHNQKLSEERAAAVAKWLTDKGVEKERLVVVGFGELRPAVPNDTKEHKDQNRRTDFKLWELDGKPTEAQKHDSEKPQPGAKPAGPDAKKPGADAKDPKKPAGDAKGATPAAAGAAKPAPAKK